MTQDDEWTDWFPHDGTHIAHRIGERPLSLREIITVKYRNGMTELGQFQSYRWFYYGNQFDIIAYKRRKSAVEAENNPLMTELKAAIAKAERDLGPTILLEEHYQRVSELLASNNALLERARKAEALSTPTAHHDESQDLPQSESALSEQVGGDHYKKLGAYQPVEVLKRWLTPEEFRGYMKGTAIVYLARERDKNGDEDIGKADHTLRLWEELK